MKVLLALTLATLCGAGTAQSVTITVATFPDLDRAARAALPRWAQLHPGIAVKIVSLQYPDHHTAMTTALATGSGLPDVMAVDFRFIGKFAEGQGLQPLDGPPYDAQALRDKFVRYTFPQATNTRGQLVAMPADIGPGTLLYRQDLLDKAGVREAELTRSWESFIEAGKKVKAATGAYLLADSADIRDIVLRSGLAEGEGLFFDAKGRVLVESPRFVRAFELGRAARQAGIDARTTAWTNEWVAGFKQNRVAAQMMGAWLAGHLKNWLSPHTAGQWRSTGLPGGAHASYGGSFYAIPAKAAYKAEAWAFIRFMTADRQTQLESLRVLDSFPALIEAQQDPLFDEPIAYLGGQKARQLWRDIAAKVPAIPVHRLDAMATDVMRAEYENVVAQGKDIRAALADARALIERRARR
ncbi:MAG: extracellular solute-binding protein [Burkholderiales bacterium]|nr:extracellular solute-binding protein [Burkholderiales bacterium]